MKYAAILGILVLMAFLISSTMGNNNPSLHDHKESAFNTLSVSVQDTLPDGEYPVQKTEEEWKEILTSKEFRILRGRGTELPYVNEYNDDKREGIYVCAGCGQKLFSSQHKYNSGTGWPSFWKPIADSLVGERVDKSFFMTRTEIVCSNCGGHLGHVFEDGPEPTGLRYCMNSAAMDFIEKSDIASNE